MEILQHIEDQIRKGELAIALALLQELNGISDQLKSELLEVEARFYLNKKDSGYISDEILMIERNRLVCSIVEIAAKIECELRLQVENSKIYTYKAKTQNWLKDSYDKQRSLIERKRSRIETNKEIIDKEEYLKDRISKLEKINTRISVVLGFGILSSLLFEFFIVKLIKEFIDWEKVNSTQFPFFDLSDIKENELTQYPSQQADNKDANNQEIQSERNLIKNERLTDLTQCEAFLAGANPVKPLNQEDIFLSSTETPLSNEQNDYIEFDSDLNLNIDT